MHLLNIRALQTPVIGPLELTLDVHETLCISGKSGTGKSRLLRAIADLDPHDGELWLGSVAAKDIPAHEWRAQVGLLPAESFWWSAIVGEHFSEPDPARLEALGLGETILHQRVTRLSSGERQRLALYRLLEVAPRVLLLDEPCANLDAGNTRRVEDVIRTYQSETSAGIIWVSHDHEQIERVADRHLVMNNGFLEPAK